MKKYSFFPVLLCAVVAVSCGSRKGANLPPPPEPITVEAANCPNVQIGENIRITSAIGESNSPVIAWSGDGFDISWWDMRGRYPSVHAVRADRTGVLRSPARMMPHDGVSKHQQVAADAEQAHLVWLDEDAVMSTRLGIEEQEPVVLAKKASHPAAGPWGAAAWVKEGKLFFRCDGMLPPPDKTGARPEPEPEIIAVGGIENPSLTWSGEVYGLAWSKSVKGGRQIMLQRLTNKGKRLGEPAKVSGTAGISRNPMVVWTGKEFAVAWTNAAPSEDNPRDRYRIFFALVPAMGSAPRLTRQLEFQGSADQVALAGTGTEFAVSWVGSKQPMGSAVYFQRLDANGMPVGETVRVSDDKPLTCGRPALAWSGDGYGVTWHDDREAAGSEVFFSFLTCGEETAASPETAPESDAGVPDETPTNDNTEGKTPSGSDADSPVLKDVF